MKTHDLIASSLKREDPARIERLNRLLDEVVKMLPSDRDWEQERYGQAAQESEDALCCPVTYDPTALGHIPTRVLEVDYGCGDPTVYAEEGLRVLDLGSGSGKHAFMIAKAVGPKGHVIGVDKTSEMLELSRGATAEVMEALEFSTPNVEFKLGHIENLRIDKARLESWLESHKIESYEDLEDLERYLAEAPLVPSNSIDLVVSNCVLNLVEDGRKRELISELYRVLDRGGSVAISDIVATRPIPEEMKQDAELWSGCISGAWQRHEFLEAFAEAGFHGICEVSSTFWKEVSGINFLSVTVRAFKGKAGPCYETLRSAYYKGPFKRVEDDDNHVYDRGHFVPVCEKTAEILSRAPYSLFFHVTPALEDPAKKLPFDCSPSGTQIRSLSEEQRKRLDASVKEGSSCSGENCC